MADHVSGPWHVQEFKKHPDIKRIIDKNGSFIADANYRPNARLIAAAPDLLAALEHIEWAVTGFGDFEAQYPHVIAEVRAAIAKATGQ